MPQGTTITLTPVAAPLAATSGVHRARHTAWDVMETLLDFMGGNPTRGAHPDIKRAILTAYNEFPQLHDWQILYSSTRLQLHGTQTTGTIAYDHTGGSYERLLTLTGATWPSWAREGYVRINDIIYDIETVIDSTRVTLSTLRNPGVDVDAGSAYYLAQSEYVLPVDFIAMDRPQTEQIWRDMYYVPPRDFFSEERHDHGNMNTPCRWTVMGSRKFSGALAMFVNPSPDRDQTVDFVYRRRMRPISVWDVSGKAAASITSGGTVVTLTDSVLKASMVGSMIRLNSGVAVPEEAESAQNAFVLERTIIAVLSSTTAQLDEPADQTLTGVGYRISDPIDLEDEAMYSAFVFGARKHLGQSRGRDDATELASAWNFQLMLAKEADQRNMSRQAASIDRGFPWKLPLKYGRRGPDVE